jgi:hypothetical protein
MQEKPARKHKSKPEQAWTTGKMQEVPLFDNVSRTMASLPTNIADQGN